MIGEFKTIIGGIDKGAFDNGLMEEQVDKLRCRKARIINNIFLKCKILQSRLFPKRRLRILFSNKEGWIKYIKSGFRHTKHELTFDDFSTENIRNYDLVVPLTIPDLKYLSKVRDLIVDNPIPIPSMESILLCDDKYRLNQILAANGFRKFIPRMGDEQTYPYILKKSIDEWGENSHIIFDSQQEKKLSDTLENPEYFSQEFITGQNEYATHILFKEQKIVWSLNIKYWFKTKTPIKGKNGIEYRQVCRCPYLALFSSILAVIGFEGLCCVNYKLRDGQPFILEINPRFGGSLCRYFFSYC